VRAGLAWPRWRDGVQPSSNRARWSRAHSPRAAASPLERGDAEDLAKADFVREFIDLMMEYAPGQVPALLALPVRARKRAQAPQPSTSPLSLR